MNYHLKQISVGLTLWATAMMVATAEPAAPAPKDAPTPKNAENPGYEVTATEIKLPGVTIQRATREVRIDAEVCLEEGLLEFVVCRPDTFEHEAIFTTKAKPEFVHAALLLCGLKTTPQLRGMNAMWAEKAMKQKQSRVKIEVEWKEKGVQKRVNLTSLLRDRQGDDELDAEEGAEGANNKAKKEPLVQDAWIFAGSFLHVNKKTGKPFYAANSSGILVGIWADPTAVIQYGIACGDPYAAQHLGLEIHEDRVPKLGTKVKLVFSLHAAPAKKAAPKK